MKWFKVTMRVSSTDKRYTPTLIEVVIKRLINVRNRSLTASKIQAEPFTLGNEGKE